MEYFIEDIERVLRANPTLTYGGFMFSDFDQNMLENRFKEMTTSDACRQFRMCKKFLKLTKILKNPSRLTSSYTWKHVLEDFVRIVRTDPLQNHYISNGMFIASALSAGVLIERCENSPNCYLALSSERCLTRAELATKVAQRYLDARLAAA